MYVDVQNSFFSLPLSLCFIELVEEEEKKKTSSHGTYT